MKPISVALICDFLEEGWTSMDLVGDMLYRHIQDRYSDTCQVTQLRPAMRRRCSHPLQANAKSIRFNADRILNRFVDYPRCLRRRSTEFDVFHIVDHSYSQLVRELPAQQTVVTCHDLDTFKCLAVPPGEKRSLPFRLMTRRILGGLSKARNILCGSESVRNELTMSGLVQPERVGVVLNGVHPSCTPQSDLEMDYAVDRMLKPHGDAAFLLHVGSTIPRKRIDILLRVFAAVRQVEPSIRLLKVGGSLTLAQKQLAQELGIRDFIHFLPHLDRRILAAIYRRASLLLLTSEAEGFGLPLVEALACGCPVVASDIPVLREIGGPVVVLCPVADVVSWAAAVTDLVALRRTDPVTFHKRRTVGISHAARFTWQEAAAQYVDLYRQIARTA